MQKIKCASIAGYFFKIEDLPQNGEIEVQRLGQETIAAAAITDKMDTLIGESDAKSGKMNMPLA